MNKQFIIKMIQAKKLQWEAFKEIMPEPVVNRIMKLQDEIYEIGKEYFMESVFEENKSRPEGTAESKSKPHKVNIE